MSSDTRLAVVGCGTIGLFAVALACYFGIDVTAVGRSQGKRALAQKISPTVRTVRPDDLDGEVFDVVLEAAGEESAIDLAFQLVKAGGSLIEIGLTGQQIDYPVIRVVRQEITILGSISYTMEDFKKALRYLQDPRLNIAPILSKIYPVHQFQAASNDALSGKFAKVVLKFGKE